LGVQAAAGLPRRDRRQHLVSETDLRARSLHLESWSSFQSYVWGSILSFNLLVFARHLLS
jgi:hypothetical protein